MPFSLQHNVDPIVLKAIQQSKIRVLHKKDITVPLIKTIQSELVSMCTDINPAYIENKLQKIFVDNDPKLDIILCTSNDRRQIYGFIITHVGKCSIIEVFKEVPEISVICTNSNNPKLKLSPAKIMLYYYISALKEHSISFGILELAGLYNNISGYCLYKKFGFDEYMLLKQCYRSVSSIPMMAYIPQIDIDDVKNVLLHNKSFRQVDVLCNSYAKSDKFYSDNVKKEKMSIIKDIQKGIKTLSVPELLSLQSTMIVDSNTLQNNYDPDKPRFPTAPPKSKAILLYDVTKGSRKRTRKKRKR